MATDGEPAASRRVVALRPGHLPAGLVLVPAAVRRPGDDLANRLVQALGSAAAAYVDLAIAFGYGFPGELVDGWLGVLVDAGVDPVDALGWAADYVDLPAQVGP